MTKIICFCAFNNSYILEYLQKEESYILNTCRETESFINLADSKHPDIILIDCTKKLSESETSESKTRENIEDIIELKELIDSDSDAEKSSSVNKPILPPLIMTDSSTESTSAHQPLPESLPESAYAHGSLPESLPEYLAMHHIIGSAAIIFIFSVEPDISFKLKCFENGYDVIVQPFAFEELKFRIKLHADKKESNQMVQWQKRNLDRALEHIDKLKNIVWNLQKEFGQEKELLHNSLKQINMMTKNRGILKTELNTTRIKLSENTKGINDFLCSMTESRNEYKKGHSKRVAQIAEFVAEKIGVDEKSIKILKNAAMLHEFGMLFIPSSILEKKPSMLSEYEKNMILMQPSNGAEYLKQCPGFEKVSEIIKHLHENSDGTGSPEGLKKRYIPLLSKILAGADELDQLWIDNPYSSIEKLLELIEDYAGSRLDPSIVNYLQKYIITYLNHPFNYRQNKDSYNGNDDRENEETKSQYIRVKEIAVYQLESGMVLGTGLFTKTGTKLFSAGTTLTKESIFMLEKYIKKYPVGETILIKTDI